MTLTQEEGRRLHVLTRLEGNQITTAQAAEALGLTARQVRRLRAGLRCAGPAALGRYLDRYVVPRKGYVANCVTVPFNFSRQNAV